MEREQKERLQELYGQYGVLFSALLRATAEADYHERTEENNQQVSDMNQIIAAIERHASLREIESMLHHLEDGALRQKLSALLSKLKNEAAAKGAVAMLKADIQRLDKNWRTTDAAYHAYATSQLAIYEAAKDMLKQMAGQGMNLVGQFVESALRGGGQGRGR
jgi:tyrosine-protein phosphatase YwqE